ncbi:hypothetical protein [Adhaeretor mobilis]|uniref:Uncharacterized protein n=1 Tax=Adhaeretor mobilis TaxID=1930276 RepID=A0A517MYW7_9BACT|nr:hypothetical protein [Adhaeretor mobilis]QDT00082.1 hypothetical protein HG15A2_34170 [Adhaeretor mobilis]
MDNRLATLALRTAACLIVCGLIASTLSSAATAQYCTPDQCDICDLCNNCLSCCHEAPELWLVNTRCLPKCCGLDAGFERISIKRYDRECCTWVRETYESFLAHEQANPMPTMLFSHGNTLQHKGALKQMWLVQCKLKCCPGKKRLVYWSWPAQVAFKRPILKPRQLVEKNLKAKFKYAEYQGYYMAKFAQRMTFSERVTLGGHSYGGIIAAAGAHYLGGGSLRCLALEGSQPIEKDNLRLAIISGAFDNDAMLPGRRYGQSFVASEKVLSTRNEADKTLMNWPKYSMYGRNSIGVTGINANRLGQYYNKLCQITMTRDVGKSHYIEPHLNSNRLLNMICCVAFPSCPACYENMTAEAEGEAIQTAMNLGDQLIGWRVSAVWK